MITENKLSNVDNIHLNKVVFAPYSDLDLTNSQQISAMREAVRAGDAYIFKGVLSFAEITKIISYLTNIGRNSMPAYADLKEGSTDYFVISNNDPRTHIKSVKQSFVFHPWNQNIFNIFDKLRGLFSIHSLMAGLAPEAFLLNTPKDDFIYRLYIQCYPCGGGFLKEHRDPIGAHQLATLVMQMSKKGEDYKTGGLYLRKKNNEKYFVDEQMDVGDVIVYSVGIPHGVDPIDPEKELDFLAFKGRWMMLPTVIKTDKSLLSTIQQPDANQMK